MEIRSKISQLVRGFRNDWQILVDAPYPLTFNSGVPGVDFHIPDGRKLRDGELECFPAAHVDNIWHVEQAGVTPLSYHDIKSALNLAAEHLVLSDSLNSNAPNWWRIIKENNKAKTITLRFCGTFGNYDIYGIDDFILPYRAPFFTSATLHKYTNPINGKNLSLDEVVRIYEQSTKHTLSHTEEIYWPETASHLLNDPLLEKYIKQS